MTKHKCPKQPRSTQIEYDWQWKWCWTTKDVMEQIQWCPYCGIELMNPMVTHIELLSDFLDIPGNTVLRKGNVYEILGATDDAYKVSPREGKVYLVPKRLRGSVYKCKEVL